MMRILVAAGLFWTLIAGFPATGSAGYSTASSRIAGTIIKSGKVASDLTSPGFPDWLALPGNRYLYKVTAVNPNG